MKPLCAALVACALSAPAYACQLRVTAVSTELSYPSTVETIAAVMVSVRNDGPTSCLPQQFNGPGLILNASGEPGGSAIPPGSSAHPFRVQFARDFSGRADCGGAGAQMDSQAMCTWSEIQPSQTVVMQAEFRAPAAVPRPFCFNAVMFLDGGPRGLFLIGQPIVGSFATCPQGTAAASAVAASAPAAAGAPANPARAHAARFPDRVALGQKEKIQ